MKSDAQLQKSPSAMTAPGVLHPTVSMAMCTYNGESYLRVQLDSIARHTRLPNGLLLCDDGSVDQTVMIA